MLTLNRQYEPILSEWFISVNCLQVNILENNETNNQPKEFLLLTIDHLQIGMFFVKELKSLGYFVRAKQIQLDNLDDNFQYPIILKPQYEEELQKEKYFINLEICGYDSSDKKISIKHLGLDIKPLEVYMDENWF